MQVERSPPIEASADFGIRDSGGLVSNTWVTYPGDRDSSWKRLVIPDTFFWLHNLKKKGGLSLEATTPGGARGSLASWWGNGLPRLRWVAGLRG